MEPWPEAPAVGVVVMQMRSDVFVYLSGPMTAKDGFLMEENVAAGLRVHLELLRHGVPNFCPQLSGAFPSAWSEVPYDRWLDFDYAVIDRCTHVLMLPRYRSSKGAMLEMAYAVSKGLPILYDVPGMLHALGIEVAA